LPLSTEVTFAVPVNVSPPGNVVRHFIDAPALAAKSCGHVTVYLPSPKRSLICFDATCSIVDLAIDEPVIAELPLAVQAPSVAALASDVSPSKSRPAVFDMPSDYD
jgi:hypothetical protein